MHQKKEHGMCSFLFCNYLAVILVNQCFKLLGVAKAHLKVRLVAILKLFDTVGTNNDVVAVVVVAYKHKGHAYVMFGLTT